MESLINSVYIVNTGRAMLLQQNCCSNRLKFFVLRAKCLRNTKTCRAALFPDPSKNNRFVSVVFSGKVLVKFDLALDKHRHVHEHVVQLADGRLQLDDVGVPRLDVGQRLLGLLGLHYYLENGE